MRLRELKKGAMFGAREKCGSPSMPTSAGHTHWQSKCRSCALSFALAVSISDVTDEDEDEDKDEEEDEEGDDREQAEQAAGRLRL
jgi:hypothetical protein